MAPEAASPIRGQQAASGVVAGIVSEPILEAWARTIGRRAVSNGLFVALYGPLGAGKSTLVRAACRGVGIEGPIPSPTFTLVNQYSTPDGRALGHVDLYRIESEAELLDLGWGEMLEQGHALFVEWAERATSHLPRTRWDIRLSIVADRDRRGIRGSPTGGAPELPPLPETC